MTHHACLTLPFCYLTSIKLSWPFTINFSNASFVMFSSQVLLGWGTYCHCHDGSRPPLSFLSYCKIFTTCPFTIFLPHTHAHKHLSASPCPPPFILCRPQPWTWNRRPPATWKLLIFLCLFVYVFVFGCTRSSSSCGEQGLLSSCRAWLSLCGGFSCGSAQAAGRAGFSSCGTQAYLPRGMWSIPGTGIKPVPPALGSRLPTTGLHQGSPASYFLNFFSPLILHTLSLFRQP